MREEGEGVPAPGALALAALGAVRAWTWLLLGAPGSGDPPRVMLGILVVVLTATGAFLVGTGLRNPRAVYLGAVFLVGGSAFADWNPDHVPTALAGVAAVFRATEPNSFLPYLFWSFFADFPRAPTFPRVQERVERVRDAMVGVGALLFGIELVALFLTGSTGQALAVLDEEGVFWGVVALCSLAAPGYGLWRARRARPEERRRVRILLAGLMVGFGPPFVYLVLNQIWPFSAWFETEQGIRTIRWITYPALLSVPFTTAYAVLVDRALQLRLVVRKAIRYAMARYTIIALTAVPFVLLAFLLYTRRDQTLAGLLTGREGLPLLGAGVTGILALRVRGRLLDAIDRLFFRETFDTRRILEDLVEQIREATGPGELERLLEHEVERALHPERVRALTLDPSGEALRSPEPGVRALSAGAALARKLAAADGPVEVNLATHGQDLLRELPEEEVHWLADAGARLLVPFPGAGERLPGLLVLGEKRSQAPYTDEDRRLLGAIASSAAVTLENRRMRERSGAAPAGAAGEGAAGEGTAGEQTARECPECGELAGPDRNACPACGAETIRAPVPRILAGKFHLESRVGAGGMGVVYRARDATLGRTVAIKTLPRMDVKRAERLRREARAMAAVSHPNLAQVFGVESWQGTPLVIFEYLPGGTLADRLDEGPLDDLAAVKLGLVLADVARTIHGAGVLHRDIKPGNIGFAREGAPKLMDFGLARMVEATGADPVSGVGLSAPAPTLSGDGLLGTVHYLSPEAVRGQPPEPSFDLWSIAVVLFEAVSGESPVWAGAPAPTLLRIARGEVRSLEEVRPDAPAYLAGFFHEALHPDPARRPGSGRELERRLKAVRRALEDRMPAST